MIYIVGEMIVEQIFIEEKKARLNMPKNQIFNNLFLFERLFLFLWLWKIF